MCVCLLAAVWGVVTAASRAAMGRHYIGDVCAGMPLGILTVAVVTKVTLALTCYMSVPGAANSTSKCCAGSLHT